MCHPCLHCVCLCASIPILSCVSYHKSNPSPIYMLHSFSFSSGESIMSTLHAPARILPVYYDLSGAQEDVSKQPSTTTHAYALFEPCSRVLQHRAERDCDENATRSAQRVDYHRRALGTWCSVTCNTGTKTRRRDRLGGRCFLRTYECGS